LTDEPIATGRSDYRNPIGWLTIAGCVLLMVAAQVAAYLSPKPDIDLVRARIEEEVQTDVGIEATNEGNAAAFAKDLAKAVQTLRPRLGSDPETQMLYAAVRIEQHAAIEPAEIAALKDSKNLAYQAAFQIDSNPKLDLADARRLASQIPPKEFLYKLVSAQALEKAGDDGPRKALASNGLKSDVVLNASLGAIGLLGLVVWWGYYLARSHGLLEPKGLPTGGLSLPDADRLAIRCGQMFLAYLGIFLLAGAILRTPAEQKYSEMLVELILACLILWLSVVPVDRKLFSLRSLGITREHFGQHVLWGIGGAVANIPILFLVQFASAYVFRGLPTPEHPVTVELGYTTNPIVLAQIAIVASILAPIVEEQIFRGTMFPALTAVFKSPIWAAVVSSLVFGMIHPTGIPAWPGLAAIGAMSCFLAYQTKSLMPSMVMHGVHNFATLIFTLLALR